MEEATEIIRVLIVEDDLISFEIIKRMIQNNFSEIEIVGHATTCKSGIELTKKHKPDLLFLDIQMEDGTGFTLLEAFDEIDFQVIFVTSYNQYAINAIKCSALDYILKPITLADLKSAIRKYKQLETKISRSLKHSTLIQNIKEDKKVPKKIVIPTADQYLIVSPEEIVRLQSEGYFTNVHLTNGKSVLVSKTLKEYEQLLKGTGFVRVHNSHLININFIKSYLKTNGGEILMEDETIIPISRRRKSKFMDELSSF